MALDSWRVSEESEGFRTFCVEPSMPSRPKLAWRLVLRAVGDFMAPFPLVALTEGTGRSMEKLSRLGMEKGLTAVAVVVAFAVVERGEPPVDEGAMFDEIECNTQRPRRSGSSETQKEGMAIYRTPGGSQSEGSSSARAP